MTGQGIRRSQFITTYGPGAILEGPSGPRIIPGLEHAGIFTTEHPAVKFEITERRLSRALLDGASIVRIPSNAELGIIDTHPIYETIPFPTWALCTRHHVLYQKRPNETPLRACPLCKSHTHDALAWKQVRREAIRFVQVCPKGHLDDVNWPGIIDHRNPGCQPSYLEWKGSGSALRNIEIVCPKCKGRMNLGYAYAKTWHCSGRFLERDNVRLGCDAEARIIQRGAANIRMAELYSALTIPPTDTPLHRLLETQYVRMILAAGGPAPVQSKQDLLTRLGGLVTAGFIGPALVTDLDRFPEDAIMTAIRQMTASALPEDNRALRRQEFEALTQAATSGAPPQPSSTPGGPPQFEVIQSDIYEFQGPGGHLLRITPASRLRVVMVQRGYRRLDPLVSKVVDVKYIDEGNRPWYPGVELYGEGIFIDLAPASLVAGRHFPLKNSQVWFDAWREPAELHQRLQMEDDRDFLHPVFVWWHTLAHRLINALSIDSGYSSAAVRERVYIDIDEATEEARGAILLYTAQPGGDGTLGGMIALVPQFNRVLRGALYLIDACSNDPLCGEEQFGEGKYNGAACYACQLVSETSCEHRNTRLDRTLLRENLP